MNAIKRWLIHKAVSDFLFNKIKESDMSAPMKSWLIGAVNALLSSIFAGSASVGVGVGWKKSTVIMLVAAIGSFGKWMAQHPIPGGQS